MRKSMLRIASVLLVAVLLTTCIISGAFAKYTTNDTLEAQSARVAKWGITLAVADGTAFYSEYKATDATTTIDVTTVDEEDVQLTVDATELAMAPGTNGSFGTLTITDAAREVAVRATIDVDVELANWIVEDAVYLPVVFSIKVGNGNATAIDVSAATGADAAAKLAAIEVIMEDAIIAAIAGANGTVQTAVAANDTGRKAIYDYNVADNLAKTVEVTWAWAFTGNSDANDTILGNAANAATVALDYTVTLDQID